MSGYINYFGTIFDLKLRCSFIVTSGTPFLVVDMYRQLKNFTKTVMLILSVLSYKVIMQTLS